MGCISCFLGTHPEGMYTVAGEMVLPLQTPGMHRVPALIAALIAFVSSVTGLLATRVAIGHEVTYFRHQQRQNP